VLADDLLLEIFDMYMDEAPIEAWHTLAHVCRKWRFVVLVSPRRLNLRLLCTASTPVRETLAVWPPLPIVIRIYSYKRWGEGNIVAALEHGDRICEIDLFDMPSSQLDKVLPAMQRPFPVLTHLRLGFEDEMAPVVPASFLGGSAPHLQSLFLDYISFPGLPKLLLSATHLVHLDLWRIPPAGYIEPEAMVTCLSALTWLQRLDIGFESLQIPPLRERLPPWQRIVLPFLTNFRFIGVDEYLEALVAQIDAPSLDKLAITFFHQLIFNTPQLASFICRARKLGTHNEARVVFSDWDVSVTLPTFDGALELELGISCRESDWQLSSLTQICWSSIPPDLLAAVEYLYILEDGFPQLHWQDDIDNGQWLQFLDPFTGVKGLYTCQEFAPRIAPALQELGRGGVTVLPALRSLFFEEELPSGPVQEAIGQFVVARRASHPVELLLWDR
jgi:hypothetical protein